MLIATQGIVLHTIPYSETSVIVKVFTERLGVRSYILKGIRKRGSRVKQGILKPLAWLDLVVYENPHANINYVKEITPANIGFAENDEVRNALLFFMDELLYRTLQEGEPMPKLFEYVTCQLKKLADAPPSPSLPIAYLISVARLLGIAPLDNYSARESCFCIADGRFVSPLQESADIVDETCSAALHEYLSAVYFDTKMPIHNAVTRTSLMKHLIDYYKFHINYFGDFTSHEILHSILA